MNFWDAIEKITSEHPWFLLIWTTVGYVVIVVEMTFGSAGE